MVRAARGIFVKYLEFKYPEYPQIGVNFLSHLGIVDTIFKVPADELREPLVQVTFWCQASLSV